MFRRTIAVVAVLVFAAPVARAQGEIIVLGSAGIGAAAILRLTTGRCCGAPHVGSRVRLRETRNSAGTVPGTIVAISADSFTVSTENGSWRGGTVDLARLEVAKRESKWAAGWLTGLLVGVGAGVVVGAAQVADEQLWLRGTAIPLFATAFGATGSLLGTAIGALKEGDRWQRVDPATIKPILEPDFAKQGARVGVSVRF